MSPENSLADISFHVTTDYEIISYYSRDNKLLFTSPENFLGKKFTEVLPANESALFVDMINKVVSERKSAHVSYELPLADGIHNFVSEYTPCLGRDNEVKQLFVLIKDVTWDYKREKLLAEAQERFRSIFDTARSGIVFGNVHMNILECNKAFCDLLEDNAENLKKKNLADFTHPEDVQKEKALLDDLLANKIDEYRLSKRYITQTKRVKWIDLSVSVIRDEADVPIFFVGIANDISEAVQTRNELNMINAAKDKLFSIIGHDLRTPLSAISTLIAILRREDHQDPIFQKQALDMIDKSSRNAIELLGNLLDWAKTQTNLLKAELQQADLSEIVSKSVDLLKHSIDGKQIKVLLNNQTPVQVGVDINMIYTVVRNLLSNAVKFTHPGGTVECSTGKTGQECWIEVRDTGIGMDETKLSRLFNISTQQSSAGTMNEQGSGLGLLICKEFVQKHNGRIEVNSEVNKGSSFKVMIPL